MVQLRSLVVLAVIVLTGFGGVGNVSSTSAPGTTGLHAGVQVPVASARY